MRPRLPINERYKRGDSASNELQERSHQKTSDADSLYLILRSANVEHKVAHIREEASKSVPVREQR
jgi:hypothetical protein